MSDKENVPNSVRSHYTPMDNTSFQNNRLHNQENDHRTTSSASETKYTSEMQMAESNGAPPRQPTSGPPMSPSFKVRGLKPQIWSPTQSMRSNAPAASVAAKDDNANVSAYQQQPRQNSIQDRFAVASHTPAVTGVPLAQEHDRNAFNTPNPHSGVYSPSSSSSGIISGTNSERTEELNFIQDYDRRATSALSADTEPTSVMFVERTSNEHRLPRSQNPTVTLLQKARESKDGRISLPAIDSQSSRTSTLQRPNEDDSWIRDREPSHVTRHVIHREPVKFEGIGPTNEKGLPIGLRSNIKEDNQHDWYKRMFKAIHRPEDETDYVLVKYQKPRRSSGYSPTPRNPYLSDSYMSEPESGRGDDNYSFSAAASDMENTNDYADYARTQSLPRSKASPERNVSYSSSVTPATRNYTIGNSNQPAAAATRGKESSPGYRTETSYNMASPYRNLPNKLDNYIPGNSSVSMQEAVQQEKLYNPPPETPRTQYSLTNITVGNLQPEKVIYRRGNVRALSPEEQREHYKEIQRGGDIPLSGLGMRTPQRAKDSELRGMDDLKLEADIDRIAAPPSKKPLTDTGNRTLTTRDINSPYMAPSRSSGGSLERQKSLERQRSLDRQRSRTSDRDDELDLMSEYRHIDEIYEREKERRHKVQQAEEERRRHHYVPIKSPIPSDRYDSVYEDPFKFAPGRPRSASPGSVAFGRHDRARSSSVHSTYPDSELIGPCRALYSFAAQNPRELSFRQGEIVHVRQQLDANWVEGNCNNRVGIAPVSYLQSMAAEKRMRAEKPLTEGHARAKYDFNAHSQVEMSIKKGETIALIRRVDQNWYEGKIGARRGIFPVSYVEVLREVGGETVGYATYPRAPHLPSSTLPLSRPGPLSTVRPSDSNYPVSNPATPGPGSASRTNTPSLSSSASPAPRRASLVEEGSDRLRYGDDVLKEFKSQVSQISPTASPSDQLLRKSSIKSTSVLDELNIPPPPSTTVKEELDLLKREPDRCRVLYTYKAQHEDELDLREGEIITILERCDDGWFRGGNKQEQQGYFPGNYVQAL
ncbi:sorbin and SH3 domain-containing protein 1-like isoform X4 [Paramacrobiotus metropolitanus]|uniref:sorbin and SH3 domain-containing protein 1-like isoform X4 n=1 Tax=Paramacrobiotus metropolitanus TaxID=2943436 RepID=UPI002446475E|nr:sorbin and SH3 domain-containing protein 1-like isoform X4 [Paramacrobiotus metropolitanus]